MYGIGPESKFSLAQIATKAASTSTIVGIRLACQALVLLVSARLLGVEGFGLVAAVVAVSLVLGPWSGLGYDFVALRAISHDRSGSRAHFHRGVRLILKTAVPLVAITAFVVFLWFREDHLVLLTVLVLLAELVFLRSTELIAKIFQGNDLFHEMALTRLSISLSRLLVLGGIFLTTPSITALQWGWANLAAAVVALGSSYWHLRVRLKLGQEARDLAAVPLQDGLYFAASITSMRLSTEFDKSLVLGITGALGAGVYGAAQRIVALAVAPIISLVNVAITSLFRLGQEKHKGELRRRAVAVCGLATLYGCAVAVLLWLFLPDVAGFALGEEFSALAAGLLPLSLLVIPTSCRAVGEQAVVALGKFHLRLLVQWAIAALSITLNLVLIPRLGWEGAAWTLLICESLLASAFVGMILFTGEEQAGE